MDKIKAISLFSSAGIGELRTRNLNINVVAANELLPQRAACYRHFYPDTIMVCDDITKKSTKETMIKYANDNNAKLLIATPPCQGLSTLGKNKVQNHYEKDRRNFLILEVFDVIDNCDFDYILIENVPKFIEMYFPFNEEYMLLEDILKLKYSDTYEISVNVLNAKDYGICQSRPRAIIRLYKKGLKWSLPKTEKEIPLKDAIGHLPSLESGENSDIPWHFAKKENPRIKGFHNTYKRMVWEQPCPARTTYSGSMSSHNNVHPGKLLPDGTYSDARVLTLLETFIVSSIPEDITFPEGVTDMFIRTVIGEAIPPRLMMKILEGIGK